MGWFSVAVSGFAAATIALGGACASGGERDARTSPTSSPERSFITTPTPTPRSVAGTSTPGITPTLSPDFVRVFSMLPVRDDLPSGFVAATEPHSVIAPDAGGPRPVNARIQFELAEEPHNDSAISCLEFYVVQLGEESEANDAFDSFQQFLHGPSGVEGQSVEALEPPAIGDETATSTLVSTKWQIGTCGTRSVYAYAGLVFRSETIVAEVFGFTPQSKPNPQLVWDMARLQLSKIEEVRAND